MDVAPLNYFNERFDNVHTLLDKDGFQASYSMWDIPDQNRNSQLSNCELDRILDGSVMQEFSGGLCEGSVARCHGAECLPFEVCHDTQPVRYDPLLHTGSSAMETQHINPASLLSSEAATGYCNIKRATMSCSIQSPQSTELNKVNSIPSKRKRVRKLKVLSSETEIESKPRKSPERNHTAAHVSRQKKQHNFNFEAWSEKLSQQHSTLKKEFQQLTDELRSLKAALFGLDSCENCPASKSLREHDGTSASGPLTKRRHLLDVYAVSEILFDERTQRNCTLGDTQGLFPNFLAKNDTQKLQMQNPAASLSSLSLEYLRGSNQRQVMEQAGSLAESWNSGFHIDDPLLDVRHEPNDNKEYSDALLCQEDSVQETLAKLQDSLLKNVQRELRKIKAMGGEI